MSDDAPLYARRGEDIVCEAGHVVTRPTRDLYVGETACGDAFEGMAHLKADDPARGIEGDVAPPCACGERWSWFGALRFREGYRSVVGGKIIHLAADEVVMASRDL